MDMMGRKWFCCILLGVLRLPETQAASSIKGGKTEMFP